MCTRLRYIACCSRLVAPLSPVEIRLGTLSCSTNFRQKSCLVKIFAVSQGSTVKKSIVISKSWKFAVTSNGNTTSSRTAEQSSNLSVSTRIAVWSQKYNSHTMFTHPMTTVGRKRSSHLSKVVLGPPLTLTPFGTGEVPVRFAWFDLEPFMNDIAVFDRSGEYLEMDYVVGDDTSELQLCEMDIRVVCRNMANAAVRNMLTLSTTPQTCLRPWLWAWVHLLVVGLVHTRYPCLI